MKNWNGATLDSRLVKSGMLFVALKGENVDGRRFIPQALEKGAAAVIEGEAQLRETAKRYCGELRKKGTKVIGVTGSAGKTTTKELLKAFFSRIGKTFATEGNFNNQIGLPLTILNAPEDTEFLILEMGTNHPGEIKALCEIATPDSGLVTNVGTAHIEFFKTREGIAREKGTLLEYCREFAAFPAQSDMVELLKNAICRAITLPVDIEATLFEKPLGDVLPGRHNLANANLAFSLASKYGLSVADAIASLEGFSLPGQRWKKCRHNGALFIDDTYNANPDSMKAALQTFAKMQPLAENGRRIAILGDMFELGENSGEFHREVFDFAGKLGLDAVYGVGEMSSRCPAAKSFKTVQEIKNELPAIIKEGDIVLLKASHSMNLGSVIS